MTRKPKVVVQVYRDICEWAVLHERICRTEFPSDTLIVRDSLLRSKIFHGTLFIKLRDRLEEGIERARVKRKRRLYLVGMAKSSKVLARYRLAMTLEDVLTQSFPCYVRIPRDIEAKATLIEKALTAKSKGAVAVLLVNDTADDDFIRFDSVSGPEHLGTHQTLMDLTTWTLA